MSDQLYPSLDSLVRQSNNPYTFTAAAPPAEAPGNDGYQLQPMRDINEINRIRANLKPGDSIVDPISGQVTASMSESGEIYPVETYQAGTYLSPTLNNSQQDNSYNAEWLDAPYDPTSFSNMPQPPHQVAPTISSNVIPEGNSSILSSKILDLQNCSNIKVDKSYQTKKTKFEIGVNCQKAMENIVLYGSVDDQMLNGFSLKLLTLGIVNTRFSISFSCKEEGRSSEPDRKCLEISRPIGTSDHIEIWFSPHGDFQSNKQKIGYVLPESLNINSIKFQVLSAQKIQRGTFKSGMARGLFSDDYTFICAGGKVKGATMKRDCNIQFTETGKQFDLHTKLLVLCAGIIIKTNI